MHPHLSFCIRYPANYFERETDVSLMCVVMTVELGKFWFFFFCFHLAQPLPSPFSFSLRAFPSPSSFPSFPYLLVCTFARYSAPFPLPSFSYTHPCFIAHCPELDHVLCLSVNCSYLYTLCQVACPDFTHSCHFLSFVVVFPFHSSFSFLFISFSFLSPLLAFLVPFLPFCSSLFHHVPPVPNTQ